jgi:hypothetical protein
MSAIQIDLPDWVVARLKQNHCDLSKAITEMVVWVDRSKIWMYQSDAELAKIIGELEDSAQASVSS